MYWTHVQASDQSQKKKKETQAMQISWHSDFKPSIWQRWNAQTKHLQATREYWNNARDKKMARIVREDIMNSS